MFGKKNGLMPGNGFALFVVKSAFLKENFIF